MPSDDLVVVGQIVGEFGIRGAVKVQPLTDFVERFDPGAVLLVKGREMTVANCSWHKEQARVQFREIKTIDEAEKLKWEHLSAYKEDLPELDEDEFLTEDLIGLEVRDKKAGSIGKVDQVIRSAASDLLVVGETLIPTVKEFVKSVDLKAGVIEVELIEGMLPGEEAEEVR
jgi:16S rRNA processing protein RimM